MKRLRPSEALELYREPIREIVLMHNASNPRVFGSTVRGEDTKDSDLDLLVDINENTSLTDLCNIIGQIEEITGVQVDIFTTDSLLPGIRDIVMKEARAI